MKKPDPLQQFADTHNLPTAAVQEFAAEIKSGQRRRKAIFILVGLLISSLLVVFLMNRVHSQTPKVVDAITTERWNTFEKTAKLRISEAFILSHRLFDFTRELFQKSIPATELRAHWDAGQADLQSLSADLKDLPNAPIDASKRLLQTGPQRVKSVISRAGAAAKILRDWLPTIVGSLGEIKPGGDRIGQVLNILDSRLQPFIINTTLLKEWETLHEDILKWVNLAKRNLDEARKTMTGEQISSEFTRRLGRSIFGLGN